MKNAHLFRSGWIRSGLAAAILLTVIWVLYPQPSAVFQDGAVEISLMGPETFIRGAMEDAVREFEHLSRTRHEATGGAYPLYRVVAGQNAQRSDEEDPTRFLLSLVGGEPPDVIVFDRFAISEWAARRAFTRLDERVEQDRAAWDAWRGTLAADTNALPPWPGAVPEPPRALGASPLAQVEPIRAADYYPGCWAEAIYADPLTGASGLYGIPSLADSRALLCNADILVRHGFTNEQGRARPPETWEELEEMAVAMTERDEDGDITAIGFIPNYGNAWLYLYGWLAGGTFLSEDGKTCTLNHPDVVYALDYMTRVYDRLGGAEDVYAFQSTFQSDALDPFIQGKVAMKIDGVWAMKSMALYSRDLRVVAAPPPLPARERAKGREPVSWSGGWSYAVPSTAREKEGAWELIRFLSSQRALEIMMASDDYRHQAQGRPFLPRQYANRLHNEWVFDAYVVDSPAIEDQYKDVMGVFNDLLKVSKFRPVTAVGQKLWNAQRWAMEDAIFHKKTPAGALDYYNASVQRDLDALLYPLEGRPIRSWAWFFWLYGLLVVAAVAWIYLWDTRPGWRTALLRKIPLVSRLAAARDAPAVLEGRKGSYFRAQWRDGVICALPWILGFLFFAGGPMLFSIVISFCRFDVLNPAVYTGLDNYRQMFAVDELFWRSLGNTVFMVMGVPLGLLLGLAMAILLTRKVGGVAIWRTFFYLPSIVPMVAASLLWIWIFNPQSGLINHAIGSVNDLLAALFGAEAARLPRPLWLQDEATSKWALIIMGLWASGGGMIIWIAGIKGISSSYYEAAAIDGAGPWQQFVNITLPMLTPYIFFNLIIGLIATFQIFAQAFIMTKGGPVNSTLFYVYHLFNNAFRYLNMGYAAAMAWFLFLIVLFLTFCQLKLAKRWVHYEGA